MIRKIIAPGPAGFRRACSLPFTLLAAVTGIWAQPAPNAVALQELLDRVKVSAMRYEGHLPDFTCTEITVRKEASSAIGTNWRTVDTFEELVSFASNGRVSKRLVKRNGRPATKKGPGGLTENALLAGAIVPRGIFGEDARAKFEWDHWETRSDHRIAVIAYRAVGFNYPDGKRRFELKVTGRIFYDETAGIMVRKESSSIGPPGYPFGEVRVDTDYGSVHLSDRELILPTSSVMTTTQGKRLERSEVQFLAYRKYDAGATIRFDEGR